MKKVFYLLSIFCITLFLASCTSSKKELPVPPVQEEEAPEITEPETVQQEEQLPEEIQPEEQQIEEPQTEINETESQTPMVEELPLPEEEVIFDEPEVIEEECEEEYEEYSEEETPSEIFEVSAEEEEILLQEPEENDVEETVEIPEGFTAEQSEEEVEAAENVNLEELNALSEKDSEEQPVETEEGESEVNSDYFLEEESVEEEGMTDEVEVEEVYEEEIIPSRTMELLKNQYLDVIYPGSGWVYLGETDDTEVFKYQGRKSETSRTVFTLKSIRGGTAILHFYKNDILTGNYIDDYLEVTVDDERTFDTKHIEAPSYEEIVPERLLSSSENNSVEDYENLSAMQEYNSINSDDDSASNEKFIQSESSSPSQRKSTEYKPSVQKSESKEGQTNIQKTDSRNSTGSVKSESVKTESEVKEKMPVTNDKTSSSEKYNDLSSEELLSKAKKSFKEKKYSETLDYLDSFFDKAVTHVDEALYLKGQTLETKSEVRNIKAALEAYEDLVKKYPQSNLWSKSNDRITYLKRFYFNIR